MTKLLAAFLLLALPPLAAQARELEVVDKLKVLGGVEIDIPTVAEPILFASTAPNSGNLGIRTAAPSSTLTVVGTLTAADIACPACSGLQRPVTGTCAAGSLLRKVNEDGSVLCETVEFPTAIFLSINACPAGYQELASFQGRYIVGLPSGGTPGDTVGSAFGDMTGINHTHAFTGTAGLVTSSVDLPHTHYVDPPATNSANPSATRCVYSSANTNCGGNVGYDFGHQYDVGGVTSSGASVSMNHSHNFNTPGGAAAATEHTPPYIQVRACVKL